MERFTRREEFFFFLEQSNVKLSIVNTCNQKKAQSTLIKGVINLFLKNVFFMIINLFIQSLWII